MRVQALNDSSVTKTASNGWSALSSPTEQWVQGAARNLSLALTAMDQAYPGLIAGVQLGDSLSLSVSLCLSLCDSLCLAAVGVAGEWMMPPVGAHTNPASGFAGDYTPQMEVEFCANERASGRGGGACKLATAAERNTPTLGNAMMQWASSAEPAAKAFRMNRFLSERTAQAIAATAAAVKSASGGSALTAAFYGYLFSLSDTRLTGSGHLSLGAVLTDPNLDVIVSPWQYRDETRQRGGAMTVHGPIDSAGNHANKLWAIEDDTYLLSRCRLPLAASLLVFRLSSSPPPPPLSLCACLSARL